MTNKNNFKSFDDIRDVAVRTFNRVTFMKNLHEDMGKEVAAEYLSTFDQAARKQMYVMAHYITQNGAEKVAQEMANRAQDYDAGSDEEEVTYSV